MTEPWGLFPGGTPASLGSSIYKIPLFPLPAVSAQAPAWAPSLPLMRGGPGAEAKNPGQTRIFHTRHCVPLSPIT